MARTPLPTLAVPRREPLATHPVVGAALDAAAVLAFVVVGRRSHAEGLELAGVAWTAWPFLAALALGWLAGRAGRRPASWRTGVGVWAVTVSGGLLLRAVTGAGVPVSFALVTAAVLAALMLGWRGAVSAAAAARG